MIRQTIIVVLFVCILPTSSVLAGTWGDDFEKDFFVGWDGLDNCWAVEKGECSGEYWNAPKDMAEFIWTGNIGWKDYTVMCKMKFAETPSGFAGISFRDTNVGRYMFFINADADTADGWKELPQSVTSLSEIPLPFNLSKDVWYELKVIVKGDNFEFYIGGKPAGEFTDNSFPSGRVGLCVRNTHAHFDDLIISGDDVEDGGSWDPAKHPVEKAVESKGKLAKVWGEIKSNQP